MADRHYVLTPDKTVISVELAGIGPRIIAHLADLILLGVAIIVSGLLLLLLASLVAVFEALFALVTGAYQWLISFSVFLYFFLFEWLANGSTPGKRTMGLRVAMTDGSPLTAPAALLRTILRIADFLPAFYFAGILSIFASSKSQRIGDIAAGTVVRLEHRAELPRSMAPHLYGLHPFEGVVGDLSAVSRDEYYTIKRLADRFPELDPHIQERTVASIWDPFAKRHRIRVIANVHPVYLMEAVVMKYSRRHRLI